MTLAELKTLMSSLTGIPSVYGYFPKEQNPPYIAYQAETSQTIAADGLVVVQIANVVLTLVTQHRDTAKETQISDLLTANGVDFGMPDFEFDETEKIHRTTYYFQTID